MLHSRLRPLPRKAHPSPTQCQPTASDHTSSNDSSVPPPDFRGIGDYDDNDDEDPEDLFASFLPHLLPDDAPSFHGDPGQRLLYDSPRYGPLQIMVPSYPGQSEKRTEEIAAGWREEGSDAGAVNQVEEGRKLFAHFLWSAAMVVAEGVEDAAAAEAGETVKPGKMMWSVKGHRVLELGAGAALPSIISVLSSASYVAITDHPSSPAFTGAIDFNIAANVHPPLRDRISAHPHEWGVLTDSFAQENRGRFSRIIAADCLWIKGQHENLVKTILWFLTPPAAAANGQEQNQEQGPTDAEGKVWIVAGFHTGRAIVASFFETAQRMGLEIEDIYERDLNASEADERAGENGEI
ncbi:Nicotinamide N-methyltransferase [Rasamsonia emersonii CBS 393.64]|uniref:Nicotinamide N-methyltransferase n=1 Tax=Rasamsonia emersonii (strain ATCC 16479 / CBS 393.64 / IMI 116815) TaxID=1408163 RepID=A0A0F4YKL0_RASE3|nr:Nicotinamide N-methyltransferase [Rasamsonia emersonii CBS 393.64]KKA18123.1 Nicotinamide N-methyltransferase [Rasamsonia emersonii CBS 393.64]